MTNHPTRAEGGADQMNRQRRCLRCAHPADWHRHDDSDNVPPTDPDCKFRCIGYDCMGGGPPTPCPDACPDFVKQEAP
jgi:hypothetical protein